VKWSREAQLLSTGGPRPCDRGKHRADHHFRQHHRASQNNGPRTHQPLHDLQQQATRGILKYASFLPLWRFLPRLHGRWCRGDAALLPLERASLGAVGLAVDLSFRISNL
jgi:hypothetical protein